MSTITDASTIEGVDIDGVVPCGSVLRDCPNEADLLALRRCPGCHGRNQRPVCTSCWTRRTRNRRFCEDCGHIGHTDEFWRVVPL